jgi:hypothetical protein
VRPVDLDPDHIAVTQLIETHNVVPRHIGSLLSQSYLDSEFVGEFLRGLAALGSILDRNGFPDRSSSVSIFSA